MYKMTCNGHPLLDVRDDDLYLINPKIKLALNTVGEGSFKIYNNHPYYSQLQSSETVAPYTSIFEVSDEYGVIFRGRMTEDTKDFDNGKDVDLEGVLAFFNDSIVSPYVFPDDFKEDSTYQALKDAGKEVNWYLNWLIIQHNLQVLDFQKFKLGNVIGFDGKSIERDSSDYPNTWEELKSALIESLGGYLCIRYEEDGNYIDYLSEIEEVNEQAVVYGENLRDISQNTFASETYSACIPLGAQIGSGESAKRLTIEDPSLPNGVLGDGITKLGGNRLYSTNAGKVYGHKCAPVELTTWDDITDPKTLQEKGIEFLKGEYTKIPTTITVKAFDLHFTNEQIRSFRMYKKVKVFTNPHDVYDTFDLDSLDIALLNPQDTIIEVGKTKSSFVALQKKNQSDTFNMINLLPTYDEIAKTVNGVEGRLIKYGDETYSTPADIENALANSGFAPIGYVDQQIANIPIPDVSNCPTRDEVEDIIEGKGYTTSEEVEDIIDDKNNETQAEIDQLNATIEAQNNTISAQNRKISGLTGDVFMLQQEVQELKDRLDELTEG